MIKTVLRSIALSVLFAIVGLFIGALLAVILNPRCFVRWKLLGYPEGEVVTDFIGADEYTVFVQAQSGAIYECCWSPVGAPTQVETRYLTFNQLPFEIPNPPGVIIDGFEIVHNYVEGTYMRKYILLKDRTVWIWEYGSDPYTALDRFARFIFFGFSTGIVIGLAFAVITHRRPIARAVNDIID